MKSLRIFESSSGSDQIENQRVTNAEGTSNQRGDPSQLTINRHWIVGPFAKDLLQVRTTVYKYESAGR